MNAVPKLTLVAAFAVAVAGAVIFIGNNPMKPESPTLTTVKVPEFGFQAAIGKNLFDANCANCHGTNGVGTDSGPPLLHNIYNPGHHADAAFYTAVKNGAAKHHWNFGNMPPLPAVSETQVRSIIRYVRELQVANGIRFKKHRM